MRAEVADNKWLHYMVFNDQVLLFLSEHCESLKSEQNFILMCLPLW